ncbi:MAG TPA: hypothetical protein VFH48_23545 [Chloroflexota bacterium]|nr:hypothetical protein [Chloroflexota bacterium]
MKQWTASANVLTRVTSRRRVRRLGRPLLLVVIVALLTGLGSPPELAQSAPGRAARPGAFLDEFTGRPPVPTPWHGAGWDVAVHSRDRDTWDELQPIAAHHGPDCAAAPATHATRSYEDAVFHCNDHIMTSLNASGYGVIYLTPNQLVDFSGGEAVVRFDMSTLRTSSRDWVDLWVTPYEDHLQLPLESWLPDLTGEPRRTVHLKMDTNDDLSVFKGFVFRDTTVEELKINTWGGYEKVVTPSAVRRDTIELRISRTSIKLGMPAYNHWWIDTRMADLGWSQGIVQLGHHSYSPFKCDKACQPNTWHWDNVGIEPAVPFTILPGDRRWASEEAGTTVSFAAPAPPESHLRFAAIGTAMEVSFDGGASWQIAEPRPIREGKDATTTFLSYWTPMPEGAISATLQGRDWLAGSWHARDFSIWSLTPPAE